MLTVSRHTPLPFTKMHGLGNDFVVIDSTQRPLSLTPEQIRGMADRHFGVGFDQLLIVDPAPRKELDFGYRIFNADGSEVGQCGNGARCFARYVREHGLTDKEHIRVQTSTGILELQITAAGQVRVNMGIPKFQPAEIPFITREETALRYVVTVDGQSLALSVVNMGNPHAVICVADVEHAPVAQWGPLLESHRCFPARVNVGFMQVINRGMIKLRVYERGTGETMACGSGACAAATIGQRLGLLDTHVQVHLRGGQLHIDWQGDGTPVLMEGSATRVFEGQWLWP